MMSCFILKAQSTFTHLYDVIGDLLQTITLFIHTRTHHIMGNVMDS